MKVVSFSLDEKNLSELNQIRQTLHLANASEAVRAALKDSTEKIEKEQSFTGTRNAVLVVHHSHQTDRFVSGVRHQFQTLVKGQNHYCTADNECIDLFLLHGSAEQIKKMRNRFLKNRGLQRLVLVPL